jgi:hypothetical protein
MQSSVSQEPSADYIDQEASIQEQTTNFNTTQLMENTQRGLSDVGNLTQPIPSKKATEPLYNAKPKNAAMAIYGNLSKGYFNSKLGSSKRTVQSKKMKNKKSLYTWEDAHSLIRYTEHSIATTLDLPNILEQHPVLLEYLEEPDTTVKLVSTLVSDLKNYSNRLSKCKEAIKDKKGVVNKDDITNYWAIGEEIKNVAEDHASVTIPSIILIGEQIRYAEKKIAEHNEKDLQDPNVVSDIQPKEA